MQSNTHGEALSRGTRLSLWRIACLALGLSLGYWTGESESQAYHWVGGFLYCGEQDINPATGSPYLPPTLWPGDCFPFVNTCLDFTCLNPCEGPGGCCGGVGDCTISE